MSKGGRSSRTTTTGQALYSSSSVAIGFGRSYFHAVDSAAKQKHTLRAEDGEIDERSVIMYEWEELPWNRGSPTDASERITSAVASSQCTFFLTRKGKVYQMGTLHGRVYPEPTLVTIPLPLKCVQISAGRHFCLGRMEGGAACVSWGAGHFGQLGIGQMDQEAQITFAPQPIVIERLLPGVIGSPIKSIAAGDWHALALTESGRVWAWGSNRAYQCGRKPASRSPATQAPTIVVPLPVPLEKAASQIAAGRSHSIAICKGQVYCWGSSHHGQSGNVVRRTGVAPPRLVDGLEKQNIVQVSAGGFHSLALNDKGQVYAWGSNSEGQLGLGPLASAQIKPRLVSELDFIGVEAGVQWKLQQRSPRKERKSVLPLEKNAQIAKIEAGAAYSTAISTTGHLYTWGSNDAGQLGIPTPLDMPLVDNYIETPPKMTTARDLDVQTFDSKHNVLLPTRVAATDKLYIEFVACGPNHMWALGRRRNEKEKDMEAPKTLYECQEVRRQNSLHKVHQSLLTQHRLVDSDVIEGDMNETVLSPTASGDSHIIVQSFSQETEGFSHGAFSPDTPTSVAYDEGENSRRMTNFLRKDGLVTKLAISEELLDHDVAQTAEPAADSSKKKRFAFLRKVTKRFRRKGKTGKS